MPYEALRGFGHRWGWSLAVAMLAATMFLVNLGSARLWDDDEPKNAGCGIEMLARGDYIVPMFNGELRSHKPVMLYWWMIASYLTFGISEFSARLPSALASTATLVITYHLGRLLFDRATGLMSAALLSAGLMFAVLSRAATPDGVLILFVMSSLLCLVVGLKRTTTLLDRDASPTDDSTTWRLPLPLAIALYLAIGGAVLTKGPIGVLLPGTAYFAFFLLAQPTPIDAQSLLGRVWQWLAGRLSPRRLWQVAQSLRVPMGLAIVAVVVTPWYVAVGMATHGEWLQGFLGTHNVHRFLEPMEGHRGPLFYHVISVMMGMFPTSCFLPIAVVTAVLHSRANHAHRGAYLLLLCWAFTWVGFFSIAATKLPNYVVPSYPAFALLTAAWLVSAVRAGERSRLWLRVGFGSLAVVGLTMAIAMAVFLPGVMEGSQWLALVGLPPLLGGLIAMALTWRGSLRPAVATFACTALVFTASALWFVAPVASQQQASYRLAESLEQVAVAPERPSLDLASYHYTRPNLTFYLRQSVESVDQLDQLAEFLAADQTAVVMPAERYAEVAEQLPFATQVITEQQKFLRPGKQVVVIGRQAQVASGPQAEHR